ncbi:MAG: symmetrical bis(5'-nucleosyl)-tetraphosphatase [Magnetococcales bacterium]|nr:symmetrical bis(5'-nucleosyl)-tetraphosphatase [Magnetococcales bacterium]
MLQCQPGPHALQPLGVPAVAVYAIGDVHGCLGELQALLRCIDFNPACDRLWFTGDLVGRGPDTPGVLRLVRGLGENAVTVMGNHELRAVAALCSSESPRPGSLSETLRRAGDGGALAAWLQRLPFFHRDPSLGFSMVHAGLLPNWGVTEVELRAAALAESFRDPEAIRTLTATPEAALPSREPGADDLPGRMAFTLAVMTRIRQVDREGQVLWPEGQIISTGNPFGVPEPDSPFRPWHELHPGFTGERILYGHWAMAGLTLGKHTIGLDSGCVYGGKLTAIRLDDPSLPLTQVDSPLHRP